MDQFELARQKFEKRATLHLPKKETPKKKDEIEISICVNDKRFDMKFDVNLSTSLLASQINQQNLEQMFTQLLSGKFGRVKPI